MHWEVPMEPITTTLLIAGLVNLAHKAAEGAAGKFGEAAATTAMTYWPKVRTLLGLPNDVPANQLEDAIGAAVYSKAELRPQLQTWLQEYEKVAGTAVVGTVHVENGSATVVGTNTGTISNTNTFGK